MSTVLTSPAWSLPGAIHRPGLPAWKVAVAVARTLIGATDGAKAALDPLKQAVDRASALFQQSQGVLTARIVAVSHLGDRDRFPLAQGGNDFIDQLIVGLAQQQHLIAELDQLLALKQSLYHVCANQGDCIADRGGIEGIATKFSKQAIHRFLL